MFVFYLAVTAVAIAIVVVPRLHGSIHATPAQAVEASAPLGKCIAVAQASCGIFGRGRTLLLLIGGF